MKMELVISVALTLVLVTIATLAWWILNWVWISPKRLELSLKKQGFAARPYRLLFGDTRESVLMAAEAKSRPFSLSHSVASRIVPFLEQTVKTYAGRTTFAWIGPVPRVNITNPEHIREVLTRIDEFGKVNSSNPFWKMIPSGVAGYEGEKWARHRKIINSAFHVEKLKLMIPVFYQTCNEMINKWEALVSKNGSGSCEVDVWPYLQKLSCDVIARTAFGSNYEEGKKIFHLLKLQGSLVMPAIMSVYIPGWRFLPTKRNRRMKAVNMEIEEAVRVIIGKREKAMNAGEVAKDDLLGILMESNLMEMQNSGSKGMSDKDVLEECKVFYFAGQETISSLLVWTLVLLSHYPYWQEAAREEVMQVFAGGKNEPDFDGLKRLKVVTMILHEVLRLYPAIIMINRRVKVDTKIGGNVTLPGGSMVSIPAVLVHQDPELWGDDAAEFNPNRFSEGVAKATKNRTIFFPFGWGPRICVGQNFALVEAKIGLATILQHFSFELSTAYVHAPCLVISLQPQFGAQIILHKC